MASNEELLQQLRALVCPPRLEIEEPPLEEELEGDIVDDDDVASYYFTETTDSSFVTQNPVTVVDATTQVIRGPRGTYIRFGIKASANLRTSDYLFKKIGSTTTMTDGGGTSRNIRFIDTTIKLTGGTTGYRIDLPVRYIKQY